MEAVKQKMKEEYDYVLIDSRTGVSDTSGICTVQLPDILVVCFTLNRQSIDGAEAVAESVDVQRRRSSGKPIRIFPVPTRVERAEKIKLDLAREAAKDRFSSLLWHIEPEEQDLYWGRVEVNYEPFYAFEEILAAFGDKPQQTSSLLASMERITSYLSDQQVTEIVPVTETERQKVLLQYARQRRLTKAVRHDSTEAATEFLFYLSYARTDWTEYLDKFVQDLLSEVSSLVGRPAEQLGFVDVNSLSPGAEWDKQLATALQHSRVLVPLYSPAYFISSSCGKEFQYFLNRQAALLSQHADQSGSVAILPVNWISSRRPLPHAAADIQYIPESFRSAYNKNGLSYLMRLRSFEQIYQELVVQFARRLVEVVDRAPLPSIALLPPLEETPNAFADLVHLFYSYSDKDEDLRNELETHLAVLRRQGMIHPWHDRRIGAGQEWAGAIDVNLESAPDHPLARER